MKYTEIIDKYLDGEMTPQEEAAFEQEVKTDPDLADEIELHQLAIVGIQRIQKEKAQMEVVEREVETEQPALTVVEKSIEEIGEKQQKPSPVIPMWRKLLPIAATLLLIPAIYFITLSFSNPLKDRSIALIEHYQSTTQGGNNSDEPEKTTLLKGIDDFKEKDYPTAIVSFDQVIEKHPEQRSAALFLKADALYRQGKKAEALQVLKSIKQKDDGTLYEEVQAIIKNMDGSQLQ